MGSTVITRDLIVDPQRRILYTTDTTDLHGIYSTLREWADHPDNLDEPDYAEMLFDWYRDDRRPQMHKDVLRQPTHRFDTERGYVNLFLRVGGWKLKELKRDE